MYEEDHLARRVQGRDVAAAWLVAGALLLAMMVGTAGKRAPAGRPYETVIAADGAPEPGELGACLLPSRGDPDLVALGRPVLQAAPSATLVVAE